METNKKEHALAIEKLLRFCIDRGLPDPTRPVVVFNADYISAQTKPVVPLQMLKLINEPEDIVQWSIAKANETQLFNFSPEQAAHFKKGVPVLVEPYILAPRRKQGSGGQPLDPLEEQIKNAAGDHIYVAVEQLRTLLEIRDKRSFTKKVEARNNAKQSLVNAYLKAYNPVIDEAKCETLINSLFKHGQRRANTIPEIATQSSNQLLESWNENPRNHARANLFEEIGFIESIVTSLIKCRVRSSSMRAKENKLLKLDPKKPQDGADARWVVAGTQPTIHQEFEDLVPAAFAGDFNPSDLFPNFKRSYDLFQTIRLIGRISKGHQSVEFSPEQLDVLQSTITTLRTWEAYPPNDKKRITSENSFLARAMSGVMPSTEWRQRYLNEP